MTESTVPNPNLGIELAVRLAGSQTKLAKLLGVGQSIISAWARGEKKIPPERAIQVEQKFEGRVSRALIRPDLWQ